MVVLSVKSRSVVDEPVVGARISTEFLSTEQIPMLGVDRRTGLIIARYLFAKTDSNGMVYFRLVPTKDIVGDSIYKVSIYHEGNNQVYRHSELFEMPKSDYSMSFIVG